MPCISVSSSILSGLCPANKYKLRTLSAAVAFSVLLSGCGGGGGVSTPPPAPDINTDQTNNQNTAGGNNTTNITDNNSTSGNSAGNGTATNEIDLVTEAETLTGRFIDSPVGNLRYTTASQSGVTNADGEFQYVDGETIIFSIGELQFPEVVAGEVITPLDLFYTDSVVTTGVANVSRFLQSLDEDSNPENGIAVLEQAHDLSTASPIDFENEDSFQADATAALQSISLDSSDLVSTDRALTHLSNSLIASSVIQRESVEAVNFLADQSTSVTGVLTDSDNDGIADVFDWDDDNDQVSDSMDQFPLNRSESLDHDGDGIGNNADDDDDNDNVPDSTDLFPFTASEWQDSDGDGYGDNFDNDDDNDGVPDWIDLFPKDPSEQRDTDNDGIGDNKDTDDDGDGVPDTKDSFILIASESSDLDADGIGDNFDFDDDNDGVPDTIDMFPSSAAEYIDTDGDGIGNNQDTDDDNDGVADSDDVFPLSAFESVDTDNDGLGDNYDPDDDNDGVPDRLDAFPIDPEESSDTDQDGTGDNADSDDDNDGLPDGVDAYPLDDTNSEDTDGDGFPDTIDDDNDNDGVLDFRDLFPQDSSESSDFDADGIGDNADLDDDNDGVEDTDDTFPFNAFESADTDGDGVGDMQDPDDDNDGIDDWYDRFPLDPDEDRDSDDDGIGNNADTDDDNDGIPDEEDPYPTDPNRGIDTDGDGEENYYDRDDDGDGVNDYDDAFPLDATETVDSDGDGIGDNSDDDTDGDGALNEQDFAPLDAACSAEEDAFNGACTATLLENVTTIEANGSGTIYLAGSDSSVLFRIDMQTGDFLDPVALDDFSSEGTSLTSVEYSPGHDRLYIGFSSGVVTYLDESTLETTYFHTLAHSAKTLVAAGSVLIANDGDYYGNATMLDAGGTLLSSSSSSRSLRNAVWSETQERVIYTDYWGDLKTVKVDQATGAMSDHSGSFGGGDDVPGPLVISVDDSSVLSGSGDIYATDSQTRSGRLPGGDINSAIWTENDGLIVLREVEENTVLSRFNADFEDIEFVELDGAPLQIFDYSGAYYVLTSTESGMAVTQYTPSDDSDNDLVLNEDDAFPMDAAASIDSDYDGSPDSWNVGYTEADSTSGLTLDSYPNDAACYLESDGDGSVCNYSVLIPVTEPDQVTVDENGTVYILFRDDNLIYRWDSTERDFIEPFYVGRPSNIGNYTPVSMGYSETHGRVYLGYEDGRVNYISTTGDSVEEVLFSTEANEIVSLSSAGDYIRIFSGRSYYSGTTTYYDRDGTQTNTSTNYDPPAAVAWNSLLNRIYSVESGYAYYITYEYISSTGKVTQTGNSGFNSDISYSGPIKLSPDNSVLILGSAHYYDATSLERLGSITKPFVDAVWLADNSLAIAVNTSNGGEIAYYDENFAPVSSEEFTGSPVALYKDDGDLVVVTYSLTEGTVVKIITP